MPPKITAKNLQYNQTLPPFLAKLRNEEANARHGGPDPLLAAQRRMGKPRSASAEAEDAPLVVDEHGNVVDLAAMENGEDEVPSQEIKTSEGTTKEAEEKKKEESGVSALRMKKRKLGKVIGAGREDEQDDEEEGDGEGGGKGKNKKNGGDKKTTTATDKSSNSTKTKSGNDKKKKVKKIKLSFGDDEEEG